MKKKYFLPILFLFAIITLIFFISIFFSNRSSIRYVVINAQKIKVEVVDTVELRNKGLSDRQSLPNGNGMLFLFEKPDIYAFWMKDMYFPLDMIWINGDKIVDISENVPPPPSNSFSSELPIYQPKLPADKVLEINAGIVEKLKIKVEDKIEYK